MLITCCFRGLSVLSIMDPGTEIDIFKYTPHIQPSIFTRWVNLQLKSFLWISESHTGVCLCVKTPLLPAAILFVLYPLSPSFTLHPLLQLHSAPPCQVVSVNHHNGAHSHTHADRFHACLSYVSDLCKRSSLWCLQGISEYCLPHWK